MSSRKRHTRIEDEKRRRASSSKHRYENIANLSPPDRGNMFLEGIPEGAMKSYYNTSLSLLQRFHAQLRSKDAVGMLAHGLESLKIRETTANALLDLIYDLEYACHEGEYVCTAILLVGDDCDVSAIGEKGVGPESDLSITDRREVRALAECLRDGFDGALVIQSCGKVLGNYHFAHRIPSPHQFLPARYWRPANASQDLNALLFLFGGEGRISVFFRGELILSERSRVWHVQMHDYGALTRQLSRAHSTDQALIQHLIRIAFRISDDGLGALISVGDHKQVLKMSDPLQTIQLSIPQMRLGEADDEAVIGLMLQDGATILTSDGSIAGALRTLRPPVKTGAEKETGKGTRHSTAASVSAVTKAFCVTVSQKTGRITIYSNGMKFWTTSI